MAKTETIFRGISVLDCNVNFFGNGNNFAIASDRHQASSKSIIVRAKLDEKFVNPSNLDGKQVYFVLSRKKDRNDNTRFYLYLYGRSEQKIDKERPYLKLLSFSEKSTSFGGIIRHELPNNVTVLADIMIYSTSGNHNDRQIICLSKEKEIEIFKKYRTNLGNDRSKTIVV
ncbi:MAG: hypothetical protein ACP6IQ_11240 [Candidatus Njordarchaeia archaeon]